MDRKNPEALPTYVRPLIRSLQHLFGLFLLFSLPLREVRGPRYFSGVFVFFILQLEHFELAGPAEMPPGCGAH